MSELVVTGYKGKLTAESVRLQLLKMQREYLIEPDDVGEKAWQRCEQDDRATLLNRPRGRGVRTPVGGARGVPG